jgi:hypothetical protein
MAGLASPQPLRRFWFELSEGRGIGVTAASEHEARALAEPVRTRFWPDATITRVITDIDISTLDDDHVVSNMGPVVIRGVWYPRLNI